METWDSRSMVGAMRKMAWNQGIKYARLGYLITTHSSIIPKISGVSIPQTSFYLEDIPCTSHCQRWSTGQPAHDPISNTYSAPSNMHNFRDLCIIRPSLRSTLCLEPLLHCLVLFFKSLDLVVFACIVCHRHLVESIESISLLWLCSSSNRGTHGFSGDFWNCLYRISYTGPSTLI